MENNSGITIRINFIVFVRKMVENRQFLRNFQKNRRFCVKKHKKICLYRREILNLSKFKFDKEILTVSFDTHLSGSSHHPHNLEGFRKR